MKLIHIADLHLGKSLHGLSLIDSGDQGHWVEQLLNLTEAERPDVLLIAGDVYDRGAPAGAAVKLLDRLLTGLAGMNIPVLMVSGNHDSGTRLAFAGELLEKSRVYISGGIEGGVKRVTLEDDFGPVDFYLLPYVFPALVGDVLGEEIRDYDTAMRKLLAAQNIDFSRRCVLIAHQNVLANGTPAQRGGSETMVGGVGEIDTSAFDGFDYVALGHIHAAQAMGRSTVRYAGSPLCYHFSELRNAVKGPVIIELGEKGTEPAIRTVPLSPLHPLREATGEFAEILRQEQENPAQGEFLRIVLTDEYVPTDAGEQLRAVLETKGSRLLELTRERRNTGDDTLREAGTEQSLESLFCDFFRDRTGNEPDENQLALIRFAAGMPETGDTDPDAQIDALVKFAMEQEV